MISLQAEVSGGQIARALLDDPEEMAYCLTELSNHKTKGFAGEVVEYAMSDIDLIVVFLRELADAFEAEAKLDAASNPEGGPYRHIVSGDKS